MIFICSLSCNRMWQSILWLQFNIKRTIQINLIVISSVQLYNSINILYVGQINVSWWWLNLIQTCQGHFTGLVFYRNRYLKKNSFVLVLKYKKHYFLWTWLNLTGYFKPGISWIEDLHFCSQCMSNSVWFGLTE